MSLFPRYIPAKPTKAAKVNSTLASLATLAGDDVQNIIPTSPLPQWQQDFCFAHAMFTNGVGHCPCSINECLISRIIDSDGDIDKLRGIEIGRGVTTDMVIDEWLETGEPAADIFDNPAWLICMAEYIFKDGGFTNDREKHSEQEI